MAEVGLVVIHLLIWVQSSVSLGELQCLLKASVQENAHFEQDA